MIKPSFRILMSIHTFKQGGVRGQIKGFIGSFLDYDPFGEVKGNVWFYEFEVQEILENWPEKDFRQRRWVSFFYCRIISKSISKRC